MATEAGPPAHAVQNLSALALNHQEPRVFWACTARNSRIPAAVLSALANTLRQGASDAVRTQVRLTPFNSYSLFVAFSSESGRDALVARTIVFEKETIKFVISGSSFSEFGHLQVKIYGAPSTLTVAALTSLLPVEFQSISFSLRPQENAPHICLLRTESQELSSY